MIEKGNGQQTAYRKVRFEMVPMDEVQEIQQAVLARRRRIEGRSQIVVP